MDSDAYTGEWAHTAGHRAMQFTAAVETNVRAVKLYRSLGFEVLGTLPKGFRHGWCDGTERSRCREAPPSDT